MAAKRVKVNGIWLDSKAEAGRYIELLVDQTKGLVGEINPHPSWDLLAWQEPNVANSISGKSIGKYTADFEFEDVPSGEMVVEDVKGQVPKKNAKTGKWTRPRGWSEFQLRLRILKANYDIDVIVVPNAYNRLTKLYENRHLFQKVLKGVEL